MKLKKEFFAGETLDVARNLLGCYLINGNCAGKIVETEAYLENDSASHSFKGKTKRNGAMFGEPGTAYVYFTYGMHHCFNVVTNKKGIGEAVLIRALEPVKGINKMKLNRKKEDIKFLCSGPAKLVAALGINKKHNGASLINGKIKITEGEKPKEIVSTGRIGIKNNAHLHYRFYIKGNPFISNGKPTFPASACQQIC